MRARQLDNRVNRSIVSEKSVLPRSDTMAAAMRMAKRSRSQFQFLWGRPKGGCIHERQRIHPRPISKQGSELTQQCDGLVRLATVDAGLKAALDGKGMAHVWSY